MVVVCSCGRWHMLGIFTDRHCAHFKTLKPLIILLSAHTVLSVYLVKQLKRLFKVFKKVCSKTSHTRARARSSSSSFLDTLSLIRRTAGARSQFSGCSSTINVHSEVGQMAVCCQILKLDALSSRSALSVLVNALFNKFGMFLNTSYMLRFKLS